MRLLHLKISGFRGCREMLDIPIEPGFLVITGRNGAGKSTICDAIEFTLTGMLSRFDTKKNKEKGETAADYVWWRGDGQPDQRFVELTFLTEDGEPVVIKRTPDTDDAEFRRKHASTFCAAGADPHSLDELVRTMMLRDESIADLSIDLPEDERFNAVERALGVTGASSREAVVVEAAAVANSRHKSAIAEYNARHDRVVRLTEELAKRRSEAVTSESLTAAEQTLRSQFQLSPADTIDTAMAESQLAGIRSTAKRVESGYHEFLELLRHRDDIGRQSGEPAVKEAESAAAASDVRVRELEAQLAQLDGETQAFAARSRDNAALAELAAAGERVGLRDDRCPLCSSHISQQHLTSEITRIRESISTDAAAYSAALSRQNEVRTALAAQRATRDRALQLVEGVRRAAADAERQLGELTDRIRTETGLTDVSSDWIQAWLSERAEIVRRIETSLAIVVTARRVERLSEIEEQLRAATTDSDAAAAEVTRIGSVVETLKALSTTVRQVTKQVTDERFAAASPLLEELYRRLRPHSEWRDMTYNVRGQVKKMLTFRVGDGLNPKFVFSSGQRRAAGLAFLLAVHLARNWCRLNTLVLDDPVQHIDDFRALHLVEVLSAIRKRGRQIICTVEDPALADLLVRRLQVEPLAGGARLELKNDPARGTVIESHRTVFALPQNVLLSA